MRPCALVTLTATATAVTFSADALGQGPRTHDTGSDGYGQCTRCDFGAAEPEPAEGS